MTDKQLEVIRRQAIDILNNIYNTYPSFQNFIYSKGRRKTWGIFRDAVIRNTDSNFTVTSGAFRAVIIDENFDWVIKFDFKEEINEEHVGNCRAEMIYYKNAVTWGIEEYFAPCFYGGEWNGVTFYLMKKVTIDIDSMNEEISSGLESSDINYASCFNSDMAAEDIDTIVNVFGSYFPYEEVTQLIEFCETYCINDFHSGNIGYLMGRPILVDYAGY